MPGQNPHLTPLELQKQLLIAESELNRDQMIRDLNGFAVEAHSLAEQARSMGAIAKSFGGIASTVAAVMAGLSAFRRGGRGSPGGVVARPSWLQLLLKNAGALSSLWLTLRPKKQPQAARV
jgi:hypothetical protein